MPTPSNYADKIRREVVGNSKDRRVEVIKDYVSKAIINFCEQEPEFAQAVEQSDKTIIDCCKECLEGVTTGISDVEACRRVVKCYFPTATIQCQMSIDLCGNTGTPPITMATSSPVSAGEEQEEKKDSFNLFLDNLLDF